MVKSGMLLLLFVSLLWASASALAKDYYYGVEMLSLVKAPFDGGGFITGMVGENTVYKSTGNGTRSTYWQAPLNQGGISYPFQLDGFSFSNPIAEWLNGIQRGYSYAGRAPGIIYSVKEKGVDLGDFSLNSMIVRIGVNQAERQVIRWENISPTPDPNGSDMNLRDFDILPSGSSGDAIYWSLTKKAGFVPETGHIGGAGRMALDYIGGQGSAPGGTAHEADVLVRFPDDSKTYFVNAWRLAECLLYPGTAIRPFEDLGYVWDSTADFMTGGRVEDGNGNEVAGYAAIRNFIRYVMDIDALVVEDVDGDGQFDAGVDRMLFSLVDDALYTMMAQWTTSNASVSTPFAGKYFNGATVFMYDGYNVTTFFDPGTGVFFGDVISTIPSTLWAGAYFPYDLDGLDIALVPEPSAVYLMLGSATGLIAIAGARRRRASR